MLAHTAQVLFVLICIESTPILKETRFSWLASKNERTLSDLDYIMASVPDN